MQNRVAVLLAVFLSTATPSFGVADDDFAHPGLLLTEHDFLPRQDPTSAATLDSMRGDPRGSFDYQPTASAVVSVAGGKMFGTEKAIKDDAIAAYLNALLWAISDDTRHRDAAIRILNSWASNFDSFEITSGSENQPQLEAAWLLPIFTNAAEIIRYHGSGKARWPKKDVQTFSAFTYKLTSYARQALRRNTNWGASSALALMSVGVFNNDQSLYREGIDSLPRIMRKMIGSDGELTELRVRDCNHPQYSLTALVQAAEIASNQRDQSVWRYPSEGLPLLAKGIEYMSNSILTGSGVRSCLNRSLTPGYGWIAERAYSRLQIALPALTRILQKSPPDGPSYQFIGWSGFIQP